MPSFHRTPLKTAYLSYQAKIAEKTTKSLTVLCKTKPISKQKSENSGRHGAQPGNTEDSKISAKSTPKLRFSVPTNFFYNCRGSSTNRPYFMQNKANFRKSQVNVNLYNTMDYEEKSDWTLGENEPKTNPIKPNLHFTAENTEYAEKKDISVSDCSIEKYALYAISPCSLRTRRLMKNKAKTKPIKPNFSVRAVYGHE